MRLVYYDLQHPLDPQVNGFGLYRTVVGGNIPLLDKRVDIPDENEWSFTHPWEASDIPDRTLGMVFTIASQAFFAGGSDPETCTSTQLWEVEPYPHVNSEDNTSLQPNLLNPVDIHGLRATHRWEIEFLGITQTRFTWAYSSTLGDSALGSAVEEDNNLPPFASITSQFQESVFLAGDPDNPHYLAWSKRFRSESWPVINFVEIGNASDPITALLPIAGVLGVFTRDTKYRVTGNAESGFVHFEAISHRGTRAGRSVTASDKGAIFVSNDGVFVTNLIGPDRKLSAKIENLFDGRTTNDEKPINRDALDKVCGGFYKDKYWFSYPAGSATVNDRTAVYDFDTELWTIYDLPIQSYFVEEDLDQLTAGDDNGFVFVIEDGASDADSDIAYEARTKDFLGLSYSVRNLFLYFKVDAEVPAGESLTAEFFVDDVSKHSVTITSNRTNKLQPLPENTWGYRWRVKLSGSSDAGGTKIHGVSALFLPLQAA